jgi:type II secretory pathway pseudopilin PulG
MVEIVVSIAILGIVGSAILGGLYASVVGSRIERDHSRAHEWLQSATEVLANDVPWADCTIHSATELQSIYQAALRAETAIVPPDWSTSYLTIPRPVQFPDPSGAYGAPCVADENRQKVLIQVSDPNGDVIETVEVVKVP